MDDPVEKYLPEFRGQMVVAEKDDQHVLLKKPAHPITVKNVLSHTSGLPFRSAIEVPTLDRLPLADRVRSYAMTPLDFEPDSKYQYSNAGINTAARIIEVVSGMSFEQFLDERLFKPLGMHETTFWPDEAQAARVAKSYKPGADKQGLEETTISQVQYPLTDRRNRYPMPAGGLFSSATDLARFYQMLANGGQFDGRRYVSEAAVKQLTSKQTPDGVANEYGFGFFYRREPLRSRWRLFHELLLRPPTRPDPYLARATRRLSGPGRQEPRSLSPSGAGELRPVISNAEVPWKNLRCGRCRVLVDFGRQACHECSWQLI